MKKAGSFLYIHYNRISWHLFSYGSKLHRENSPAVQWSDGVTSEWYLNGKLHRIGGPAVSHFTGYKAWYLNGELHRVDGPAIEHSDRSKEWYLNNNLHRIDGPAIDNADGSKEWYLEGIEYTEAEYLEKVKEYDKHS